MKTKIFTTLAILILASVLMQSCGDRVKKGSFFSKNFVCEYVLLDDLACYADDESNIHITSSGLNITALDETYKFEYDSLSNKFGDTSYNQTIYWSSVGPQRTFNHYSKYTDNMFVGSSDIANITITCDSEWDESHPAGSPLNDIVEISIFSPYNYIKNGYNGEMLTHTVKRLDLMTDADFHMACWRELQPMLSFLTKPSKSEELYHIRLIITLDDGRTIQDSVDCSFE